MTVTTWAEERLANSERLADLKTGADREGWLEDVAYWRVIVTRLRESDERRRQVRQIFAAFEENIFVRNISRDGDPGWALRCVAPLHALAKLKEWAG